MRALFILGRLIFGGYFVWNGINHFRHRQAMTGYASSKGVAAAQAAVPGTGGLLVTGGLSVLTGTRPRQGLLTLVGFLVPVSLQMHRFWDEADPGRRTAEMINFTKNMALVGAALMLMALPEPWPVSLDRARLPAGARRLNDREMRALPA